MLAALLATQTTGTPATVGAAPGIASFSSPPGAASAQVSTPSGGPFGEGRVGVYARRPPPAPKPISIPAVARALPGQIYSHSASGRAIGGQPLQVVAALAPAAAGECFTQIPAGRAIGAARVLASVGTLAASSPAGTASGAAAVRTRSPQALADLPRGRAIGLHNPTDEELAALTLLLDDLVRDAA